MNVLGIDIGGSGIKAAVVDTDSGRFVSERVRRDTPAVSTPRAVGRTIAAIVRELRWRGPIGVGFPGIVRGGIIHSCVNLHPSWMGQDIAAGLAKATRCRVRAINDADAAGLAEVTFGAGRTAHGTVIVLTLGSGIGSALFHDGRLVPNTEFGHLEFRDGTIERHAAASLRKERDLRWKQWSRRVNRALLYLDSIFSPDLIILGGGVSAKFEKIAPHLDESLRVVPARMRNEPGIVGAALAVVAPSPASRPRSSAAIAR